MEALIMKVLLTIMVFMVTLVLHLAYKNALEALNLNFV